MDEKALFLRFWQKEAPATRKVISRIPEERSDYKPEPKSRNAREIAWLVVMEEGALVEGLENGQINWQELPVPARVREILDTYDQRHDELTRRLTQLDPSAWERQVPFLFQGQEVLRARGYELAWEFLFDQIHHRGQLSTYLRPMGSTVPSIYGPSADEPG
ncbi:MAG: DinB family protein [Candidatus Entotheonellia bacterium]